MTARSDPDRLPLIVQAVTTEHFCLQSARTAIATEAVGRTTIYLGTVSSALIAMGFLGQLLRLQPLFLLISLILLATLFMLGIVTSVRLTQLAIDDMAYQRAINRLRHWYLEIGPSMRPYFLLSDRDDQSGVRQNLTVKRSGWQLVFSTNGALTLVNSLLGAVAAALAAHLLAETGAVFSMAVGVGFCVASAFAHALGQARMWTRAEQRMPVAFPSSDAEGRA